MNRVWKCVRFEISRILPGTMIFLAFYFLIYLFIYCLFLLNSKEVSAGSFNMSVAADCYFFAIMLTYYSRITNQLTIFANTRRAIFLSMLVTNALFSILLAVISVASEYLGAAIYRAAGAVNSIYLIPLIYGNNSIWADFLWNLCALLLISAIALMMGSLQHKFGRRFIIIFWVAFAILFTIIPVLYMFLPAAVQSGIMQTLIWYISSGIDGVYWASLHFVVTGAALAGITWLIVRRQQQVA